MGKSDDSIRRRKNKLSSRKKQNDSALVSARVASIIAAKKRRKTGKRSMCQGMCYSLPTPEDPFNDKIVSVNIKKKDTKKVKPLRKMSANRNHDAPAKDNKMGKFTNVKGEHAVADSKQKKITKLTKRNGHPFEINDCPSKFLLMCLNTIQTALRQDEIFSMEDKPLFADTWGVEFWKSYSTGKDILETSEASSTLEQIAWITSTAADTIAQKEKDGFSINNPFLLFLVPSQEKASMVRGVCKHLKALGLHTVSVHPGASLEHQIHGLRSCEPEFLVSTPERLLELLSMEATDISGISLLVVDGLETYNKAGLSDVINSIRQYISGNPQTLVFNGCSSYASIPLVRNLLPQTLCRVTQTDSIASQSACIIQSVHVCDSEEEKLAKMSKNICGKDNTNGGPLMLDEELMPIYITNNLLHPYVPSNNLKHLFAGIQVLEQICSRALNLGTIKLLFIVGDTSNSQELVTAVESKGYSISTFSADRETQLSSETSVEVFMMDTKVIGVADFTEFDVILILNFTLSIDNYKRILTSMARFTANGMLHSFLRREEKLVADPLVEILEQCRQEVPEAL